MSEAAEPYRPPTPWVVWLIVGAIAVSYAAFMFASPDARRFADYVFAIIPERFDSDSQFRFGQWYEWLGPIFGHVFLHVAWWHAAINGFFFFLTARYPAMRLGPWRFLLLFFFAAAMSALFYIVINWDEQAMGVGASGALCGVFSAYFLSARHTWRQSLADPGVRNPFMVVFGFNVVAMGIAAELFGVLIAWEAHLGGFVGGAIAWIVLAPRPRGPWG